MAETETKMVFWRHYTS